jgi:hypothetical protein
VTINRDAAEAIAANLKRYVDVIDTFTEAMRIATAQDPAPEQGNPEPEPASRCVHGATAEELCNKLPSDAELAELRAADGERGAWQREARVEKGRADIAEAELQAVWEQIGYPDPDRRPYNQTAAGAVAAHIGYLEARLARVNGPAVAEVLTTPRPNIEEIVQAVVRLAHGPMMPLDGDQASPVDAEVSPEVSPPPAPAGDPETNPKGYGPSPTGHWWPCTRFFTAASPQAPCTCTPLQVKASARTAQELADAPDSDD